MRLLLEGATLQSVGCHTAHDQYGGGNAVEIETAHFLYGLVRRLMPRMIVETGTYYGFSTAWIALALEDNAAGCNDLSNSRIATVDFMDHPENLSLWEKVQVQPWIHRHVADSRTWNYGESYGNMPIDILFLDGSHREDDVLIEVRNFIPFLNREQCLILFHDTHLDDREGRAVEAISRNHDEFFAEYLYVSHIPWRTMRGLDMIFLNNT